MSERPTSVVQVGGVEYIRPDNGCYPCDVYGPKCPWHKSQWVAVPLKEKP